MHILSHRSFPRAILHVDGDCFFASCEIAKNPSLRGKCVITGKERGIASSMSYEAKARGVTRAMRLSEIRRLIPEAIILPSDYETYSIYSERMYAIVRRYTEAVEEYSIDECFAELSGMRRPNKMSYEQMAMKVKHDLDTELGMTFSIGLSVNKVLAKVASKWRKPSGLTIIPGYNIHLYLAKWPVENVWGIGPQTSSYLRQKGIHTALEFAERSSEWVRAHFSKPFQEIHRELNGSSVYPLILGEKHDYASISKTRTFTPPSTDREFVFAQLSKNIENACIKLRRHHLFTKRFAFFLKTQEFRYRGLEVKLSQAVSAPQEIIRGVRGRFDRVFQAGMQYRATGIALMELDCEHVSTIDLFGETGRIERTQQVLQAVDAIDARFGKHTVFLGSSFKAIKQPAHRNIRDYRYWRNERGEKTERRNRLFKGETDRKRLAIPVMGEVR